MNADIVKIARQILITSLVFLAIRLLVPDPTSWRHVAGGLLLIGVITVATLKDPQ